jgi:hypothetical protein
MTKMSTKLGVIINNILILIWELWFSFSAFLGFLVVLDMIEKSSTTVIVPMFRIYSTAIISIGIVCYRILSGRIEFKSLSEKTKS